MVLRLADSGAIIYYHITSFHHTAKPRFKSLIVNVSLGAQIRPLKIPINTYIRYLKLGL